MTLPAEIIFSVGQKVDLRRVLHRGFFAMTYSTEFSFYRLCRPDHPGVCFVILRGFVTGNASQEEMGRTDFYSFNLRVARRTLFWHFRRFGIVRVVAFKTGIQGIMGDGKYLGKTCRSRKVVRMTLRAEVPLPGRLLD